MHPFHFVTNDLYKKNCDASQFIADHTLLSEPWPSTWQFFPAYFHGRKAPIQRNPPDQVVLSRFYSPVAWSRVALFWPQATPILTRYL